MKVALTIKQPKIYLRYYWHKYETLNLKPLGLWNFNSDTRLTMKFCSHLSLLSSSWGTSLLNSSWGYHFILFVFVMWILFHFVCTCSALLLYCFHVVSGQWRGATTTFDSAVAVSSLSKTQMIIWSSNQFCCCCVACPRQNAFELMFAWIRKGYGNSDGVSFWLGLHFLRPAHFLAGLVHPNKKNQLRPSTPCTTVWIILQTSPFNCFASCLFAWPFHLLKCVFDVSLFRDTWLDNRTVFFGVLANYLLWKCKCNIFLIAYKLTTTTRWRLKFLCLFFRYTVYSSTPS